MKVLSYTLAIVNCDNSSISKEGIKHLCSTFKNKANMDVIICNADKSGISCRGLFPGMIQLSAYLEPREDGIGTGFSKILIEEKVCATGIILFNRNISKDYTADPNAEDKIIEKYKTGIKTAIKFIEEL